MIQKFFKSAHEDFLKRNNTQYYIRHAEAVEYKKQQDAQDEVSRIQAMEKLNSMRKTIADYMVQRLNDNHVIEKYRDHEAFKNSNIRIHCMDIDSENKRNAHDAIRAFDEAHSPTTLIVPFLGKVLMQTLSEMEDYILIGRELQSSSGDDNVLVEVTFKDYYTLFFIVDPLQSFENPNDIVGNLNIDEGEVKLGDLIDGIIESMENKIKVNIGFNYEQEERVRLIERNSKSKS